MKNKSRVYSGLRKKARAILENYFSKKEVSKIMGNFSEFLEDYAFFFPEDDIENIWCDVFHKYTSKDVVYYFFVFFFSINKKDFLRFFDGDLTREEFLKCKYLLIRNVLFNEKKLDLVFDFIEYYLKIEQDSDDRFIFYRLATKEFVNILFISDDFFNISFNSVGIEEKLFIMDLYMEYKEIFHYDINENNYLDVVREYFKKENEKWEIFLTVYDFFLKKNIPYFSVIIDEIFSIRKDKIYKNYFEKYFQCISFENLFIPKYITSVKKRFLSSIKEMYFVFSTISKDYIRLFIENNLLLFESRNDVRNKNVFLYFKRFLDIDFVISSGFEYIQDILLISNSEFITKKSNVKFFLDENVDLKKFTYYSKMLAFYDLLLERNYNINSRFFSKFESYILRLFKLPIDELKKYAELFELFLNFSEYIFKLDSLPNIRTFVRLCLSINNKLEENMFSFFTSSSNFLMFILEYLMKKKDVQKTKNFVRNIRKFLSKACKNNVVLSFDILDCLYDDFRKYAKILEVV